MSSDGPLEGLVVVDLSANVGSAWVTQVIADYGAEVIQIEPPGGSRVRSMPAWPMWLRGKKSIVLDLTDAEDLETARTLCAGADVVVEAFGAGVADKLGVGYDQVERLNPTVVYTSISGFGHTGPFAHLQSYEAVVMAKTGSMYGNTAPHRPGPVMTQPLGATMSAGLLALQGTFLALHQRHATGHGQRVDATLAQGMLAQDPWSYFMAILAEKYPDAFSLRAAPSPGRATPFSWLAFGLINAPSKDGRWFQFAHATPRQFDAFIAQLGLTDLLDQPEWKDAPNSPDDAVRDRWWTKMLEVAHSRTVAQWQEIFDHDPNVFAEVYLTGTELFDHPQMVHDHHVATTDHPEVGTVRYPSVLVKMSNTPGRADRPTPTLDQHGVELRSRPRRTPVAPSTPAPTGVGALSGITVVDLGTFYAGPFASTMFTDHGARVIKVEPLEGDPIRFQMPMPESSAVRVTQGKQSIAVNTKSEEGLAIVIELIKRADMVLHTYRGGVAERMGLDADRMRAINPDLVYHHGVGYGIDGPYAAKQAYAPTIAAASGFATRSGGGGADGTNMTLDEIKNQALSMGGAPPGHPDGMAALGASVGLALGLYARDRGHGGQVTLTSMLSTMSHMLSDGLVEYEGAQGPPIPDPDQYGYGALYRLYPVADDGWIVLCAPAENDWQRLASSLAELELATDPRFATTADRRTNDEALATVLAAHFAGRAAIDLEHQLSAAGIGCAEVAPNTGGLAVGMFVSGGVADQMGMLTTVEHPLFGEHARTTELVTLAKSAPTLGAGVTIGQHTDAILRELGYDDDRIVSLRAEGVIGG